MKPILFVEEATNFSNNGIGVLYDAISCEVYEERNGAFEVELEYPTYGQWAKEILQQRIILAKPNDVDAPHAFRIYEIQKDLESGIIFVRGTSITNDLSGNLLTHVSVEDATPQEALTKIKANLLEPTLFDLLSDIQVRSTSEWTRINPLQAIVGVDGSLVDIWGGDIKRTNNAVHLYSRRGRDKVAVIRPGKNIDGFNMTVSTKGIVTKILPYYSYIPETIPQYEMVEDYDGNRVKQQVYNVDSYVQPEQETVLGDVVVSPNADKYSVKYYIPVDYSQDGYIQELVRAFIEERKEEAELSPTIIDTSGFQDDLKQYILELLNEEAAYYFIYRNPGSDEPSIEIKVDMIQLSDSPEWERYKNLEQIQVTDTVDVYVKQFDVDVEVTINSVRYDSIAERVISLSAGTARTTLSQSLTKTYEDKTKELEQYIDTLENGVYNSISRTASGQNRRFSGYTEPPASVSSEGDMWFKEVGAGVVETYIYTGGSWQPVLTGEVLEAMQQAVDNAEQLAMDADEKAQSTIDDINDVVTANGFTSLDGLFASKITEDDFSTLFYQEAETIGFVYEEGGVTKAIIAINSGIPYIKGEHIILNGDTIVDGTFTVTDQMIANEAVINKLKVSGIDAQEVNIINLNANNITSGNLELSKGLQITNNGVPVLTVDATTGQVKLTAPNVATKDDLNNLEIGGRNYFQNSSFEFYRENIEFVGAGMTSSFVSNAIDDKIGCRIHVNHTVDTWAGIKTGAVSRIPVVAGDPVTMSVWVKVEEECDALGMSLEFMDAAGLRVRSIESATVAPPTDGYVRYVLTGITPSGYDTIETASFRVWIRRQGKIVMCMPKLEKGNKATDWTPAPEDDKNRLDKLEVGARNLLLNTTEPRTVTFTGWQVHFNNMNLSPYGLDAFKSGGRFKLRGYIKNTGGVDKVGLMVHVTTTSTSTGYAQYNSEAASIIAGSEGWFNMSLDVPADELITDVWISPRHYSVDAGQSTVEVSSVKLEMGDKFTDWTPAPEDTKALIDMKANDEDVITLAGIITNISSELNHKAGMNEFEALQAAYEAQIAKDISDKAALQSSLSTLEGRTSLVEILAGESKLVTQFIETVITQSEEGIFIGNEANNTGILLSDNRISFLDNSVEVAYISNQTMEISHGIFVESATISDFKFEKIPGTTILAIRWVGV